MDGKRRLVVVDPGHGGADSGAVNPRTLIRESDLNLDLALLFAAIAEAQGLEVALTRSRDESVSLQTRASLSNDLKAAVFLSFHCNAAVSPAATGFEVWTTPEETRADALATEIFEGLALAATDKPGRADYDDGDPDKEARFFVLRNTRAPAVLIEFGFVSNDEESIWLENRKTQSELARGVLEALQRWFG